MLWLSQISGALSEAECDSRAWIRIPPKNLFSNARILDETHIRPLTEQIRDIAIKRLRANSVSKIGASELPSLGIGTLPNGMQAFFVRGVAYSLFTGGWTLKFEQNMLYVRHDSLGPPMSLRCEPILVFLDKVPGEIFIGASLAK
jgi:hypothetical protein